MTEERNAAGEGWSVEDCGEPEYLDGIRSQYTVRTEGGRPVAYAFSLEEARHIAAVPDLLSALRQAALAFRFYEQSHLEKNTPDADAKAHRNHELATVMEAALAKVSPPLVLGLSSSRAKVAAAGATRCAAPQAHSQSEGEG